MVSRIYLIVLFIIPVILVVLWFKDANILGTGESGLPFYDLMLQFKNFSYAWANYALGHPTNITIASVPTYWFFAQLQNIGVPAFLLQAFFLWFSLTVSGISIYFLTKELFPKLDQKIYLLAPLFYWFNPFGMVNVWNRFLNNFLVFYACLPLVLLLFIKGIRSKKYIYAILIGLSSLILSYASSSITFSLILWFVLSYTALFYVVLNRQGDKLFVVKFFLITLLFWFFINFWWISQVLSYVALGSFSAVTSSSFTTDSNYNTFFLLSQRLGNLIDVVRLKHASFFADIENIRWVGIYQFPLLTLLEFLIAGTYLLPIIIRRRQKEVLFLGGLFILSIFFMKGNNPPLGEIFNQAFINFSFLQLFRNPLEKIGFILPLSAAPLFCLGVSLLIGKFATKWRRMAYLIFLSWLLIIWGGSFWSSLVFTGTESPTNNINVGYQVKVPEFYKDVSNWLSAQGNNFRLIIFPIGGEGITYTWPQGYSGVELSNQLLPVTSVSFSTNIPFYKEVSSDLERIFLTRENFPKVMDLLNAKYIVVRSDIDWKIRGMRNPHAIQNRLQDLESEGKFRKIGEFGNLLIWENLEWKDNTVYATSGLTRFFGSSNIEDILAVENHQDLAIYNGNSLKEDRLIKSEVIKPDVRFGLGSEKITEVNISDDFMFPSVRILPSEYLYPLILLKEKIEMNTIKDHNTLILKKLSLLGKRLHEAVIEAEKGHHQAALTSLNLYRQQLRELLPDLAGISKIGGDFFILQEDAYKIFLKHFDRFKRVKNAFPEDKKGEIVTFEETLRKELIDYKIIPYFGYLDEPNFPIQGRMVYQFTTEEEGDYELLLDSKSWDKYFKTSLDKPFIFQVDREIVSRIGKPLNNKLVSYGFFHFTPGKHEIAWNTPEEINLVDASSQLNLRIDHGVIEKSFPINNFDSYSEYVLSLNYWLERGSGVEVIVSQDNDRVRKGKPESRFGKLLGPDTYDFDRKDYTAYIIPSTTADSANLIFRVKPWNNCEEIFRTKGKEKCLDENFRRPYDRITEVSLDNISLVKVSTEIPILRKEEIFDFSTHLPRISYKKINATEYKVKIEGAKGPFIFVLSQLFDPAWKIYIDGKEAGQKHFLANTYANGWIIDRSGNYDLTLKFTPQDLLVKGEIVSLSAAVAGLILVLWKLRKNHHEPN